MTAPAMDRILSELDLSDLTGRPMELPPRFWEKVNVHVDCCWLWTGAAANGYGYYWHNRRVMRAHRVLYELAVGPIPEGFVLDHLCRVPMCIRPDHLEAVTEVENIRRGTGQSARNARKTLCPQGHPYDEQNTRFEQKPNGRVGRRCRTCRSAMQSTETYLAARRARRRKGATA